MTRSNINIVRGSFWYLLLCSTLKTWQNWEKLHQVIPGTNLEIKDNQIISDATLHYKFPDHFEAFMGSYLGTTTRNKTTTKNICFAIRWSFEEIYSIDFRLSSLYCIAKIPKSWRRRKHEVDFIVVYALGKKPIKKKTKWSAVVRTEDLWIASAVRGLIDPHKNKS